ncbi:hypothetical protein GCM10007063_34970 [Lentibacillus kapialis]|uniref:Uncharacterized protein n=1 Tax=Lentibacillus kapialis TaxID=340214 RepID=A0A917Q2U9_9BACI|nr:hypothetical protein [Lentibacillus kapialis]GGK09499.1 hypothetical protein GCM10007063_34970 [Lentibacillus kapialis]
MSKKLQSFGFVLLISGTVLFGIMHLAIALYMPDRVYTATPPSAFVTRVSHPTYQGIRGVY